MMLKTDISNAIEDAPSTASAPRWLARVSDRQRARRNFLTWPFFLAEMVVADLFFGKGLHTADALDLSSSQAKDQPGLEPDESRVFGTQNAEDPELNQTGLLDYPDQTAAQPPLSETAAAKSGQATGGAGGHIPTGGGGSAGGAGDSSSANASADTGKIGSVIPNELSLFSEDSALSLSLDKTDLSVQLNVAELLDIGLDLSLADLVFPNEPSLIPLDSALSLNLDENNASVQLNVAELMDIGLDVSLADLGLGGDLDPLLREPAELVPETHLGEASIEVTFDGVAALSGDVSSGGAITFSEPIDVPIATDELFIGGRYTEYHMALQSTSDPVLQSSDLVADAHSLSGVADLSHDLLPDDSSHSGDNGIDSSFVTLPSTDDELEVRGITL